MSKRNEIKQKEQIQLQLQAQFNKLDQTVLSWLKPTTTGSSGTQEPEFKSKEVIDEFNNQIVVPNGKGISFGDEDSGMNESSVTISDFLDSTDSRVKSKRKEQNDGRERMNKISDVKKRKLDTSSNSLRALSNKLRNDKRGKFENNSKPQEKFNTRNLIKKEVKKVVESDSDSEDDVMSRKSSGKKGVSKGNVKNKRPF